MSRATISGEQEKYIQLNKRFMEEVEKGTSWSELRWLIDEMKELAKNFEHLQATVIDMNDRSQNSSMERSR